MKADKISVIIPVYKVEPYLRQCLDSVIDQTYNDLEIILIDDGSPDNCGAICDEYAAKDDRIIVIHKENGGLSAARNDGIARATGEWLAFVDSDDWCEPTMYEKAAAKAKETDADIVMFSLFQNSKSGEERIHAFSKEFVSEDAGLIEKLQLSVLDKSQIPFTKDHRWGQGFPWDKLFRRSMIEYNHLRFAENVRAHEDVIFNIHAFQFAKKVAFFDEPLYHWRMNAGSIGHKYMPDRPDVDRAVYQEMIDIGHRYGLGEEDYHAVNVRMVNTLLELGYQCYFNPQHGGRPLQNIRQLQKELDSEPFATAWKEVQWSRLSRTGKVLKYSGQLRALGLFVVTSMRQRSRKGYMDTFDLGGGCFGTLEPPAEK